MAGHSQFKNIMHRKGKQDEQKAKIFNKIAREIVLAVRGSGDDPSTNARLRLALQSARAANMPNDRITRAIKTGTGENSADSTEEIRYEGYGPGGVALIIEVLTDNRNRTVPEIRSTMSKYGGAMGESNSVAFQFNKIGQIIYAASVANADSIFEYAAEVGADNVESDNDVHVITTSPDQYMKVLQQLNEKYGSPLQSGLIWEPMNRVAVSGETAQALIKLIHALDDLDDVQQIFGNYDLDESDLMKLAS